MKLRLKILFLVFGLHHIMTAQNTFDLRYKMVVDDQLKSIVVDIHFTINLSEAKIAYYMPNTGYIELLKSETYLISKKIGEMEPDAKGYIAHVFLTIDNFVITVNWKTSEDNWVMISHNKLAGHTIFQDVDNN